MDIDLQTKMRKEGGMSWSARAAVARTQMREWTARLQNGLMLTGWVMLGLGLIALLVIVLARLPLWFGPVLFGPKQAMFFMIQVVDKSTLPAPVKDVKIISTGSPSDIANILFVLLPVVGAILLYLLLTVVQPKIFPWPQQRTAYLLAVSAVLITGGLILLPRFVPQATDQFQCCVIAYAIAAHARVTFSKKWGWAVEALVLVVVLISIFAMGTQNHPVTLPLPDKSGVFYKPVAMPADDQWLLRIPMLGIQVGGTLQVFQAIIWGLGLLCLHIFTGIGVHERNARRRSDALVKELTLAQEQLRAYAMHAEELATMRERARMAREMHDTLAQGLAAMKMHLETSTTLFEERPDLAREHVERARTLAGEYLNETRNSILNLRADALNGRTLPAALDALAAAWQPASGEGSARVCLSGITGDDPFWQTLPPALDLACYRIVQEALSNASRHGHARQVEVELSIEDDELCLTITDDGQGFNPGAVRPCRKGGGFGIVGMYERLKLLKGRLEILSAPGAGTQVVAMIPLLAQPLQRAAGREVAESRG